MESQFKTIFLTLLSLKAIFLLSVFAVCTIEIEIRILGIARSSRQMRYEALSFLTPDTRCRSRWTDCEESRLFQIQMQPHVLQLLRTLYFSPLNHNAHRNDALWLRTQVTIWQQVSSLSLLKYSADQLRFSQSFTADIHHQSTVSPDTDGTPSLPSQLASLSDHL